MKHVRWIMAIVGVAGFACSSGDMDEPRGGSNDGISRAPAERVLEFRGGKMRLHEGVELLAKVDHPSGNELFFVREGKGWTVMESGPAGNESVMTAARLDKTSPVAQFRKIVPGMAVPQALLDADAELSATGRVVNAAELVERQKQAADFQKLKQGAAPPREISTEPQGVQELAPSTPAEGTDGLQQASSRCNASWFDETHCTGFLVSEWNTVPERIWKQFNGTVNSTVNGVGVDQGRAVACTDWGDLRLDVTNTRRTVAAVDLAPGKWFDTGVWAEWDWEDLCLGWRCQPLKFPADVTVNSRVLSVTTGERFHFCGFYNSDGG